MSGLLRTGLIAAWAAGVLFTAAPSAAADDPFYKGKRLNLMINFAPGETVAFAVPVERSLR